MKTRNENQNSYHSCFKVFCCEKADHVLFCHFMAFDSVSERGYKTTLTENMAKYYRMATFCHIYEG